MVLSGESGEKIDDVQEESDTGFGIIGHIFAFFGESKHSGSVMGYIQRKNGDHHIGYKS